MAIMILEDLAWLVTSKTQDDLVKCRIVGYQQQEIFKEGKITSYRIHEYWNK